MGMLTTMTILKQKEEAEKVSNATAEVKEEIPFTEPEEKPEKKEVPKTTVQRGRRKGTK